MTEGTPLNKACKRGMNLICGNEEKFKGIITDERKELLEKHTDSERKDQVTTGCGH